MALRHAGWHDNRRSRWALEVESRRGSNIATVALANKNTRAAWAILAKAATVGPAGYEIFFRW